MSGYDARIVSHAAVEEEVEVEPLARSLVSQSAASASRRATCNDVMGP